MMIHVETPRLLLREFTEDDDAHLFALDDDPEVMRYIGPHRLPDVEAYRERIRTKSIPYYALHPGYGFWATVEKASGAFLGWFHLRLALDYPYAADAGYKAGDLDLGYRFHRAAWGKGYATEGSVALVRKGFADPAVARVVAAALASNAASVRVLEKVGLRRMGEFRIEGYDQPVLTFALNREQVGPQIA